MLSEQSIDDGSVPNFCPFILAKKQNEEENVNSSMQLQADIISLYSNVEPMDKDRFVYDSFTVYKQNKQEPINFKDLEKPLQIQGVKIYPGCMIFKDAYDGKTFDQPLTILNCGKTTLNIRILSPTSKAFKLKPMLIGHNLSPGLSIVKRIKYLYTKPTAIHQACMDIYINNSVIRYELIVTTSYALVQVSPKILDFGEINVGMASELKNISLKNSGTKRAQYAIDMGRNLLQIIVEPTRGVIQPEETKEISVEVFGIKEGDFSQEFWIKTEPLQRVHLQGRFIRPGPQIDYPFSNKNLVILRFPRTFFGVHYQRSVIIRNHSSASAIMCVQARTSNETLPYEKAALKDFNLKQFSITPLEGRLVKNQKIIIGIQFIPRKLNHPSSAQYFVTNAMINVKKCRVEGNPCRQKKGPSTDEFAIRDQTCFALDTISLVTVVEDLYENAQEVTLLHEESVALILYGEVETPNVTLDPNNITLTNLKVYETYEKTIKIMNYSKTLSLVMEYNKVCNIEFEPKTLHLPPSEFIEAILKIRPTQMGRTDHNIIFDLFYHQNKQSIIKVHSINLEVSFTAEYTGNQKLLRRRNAAFLQGITPFNCNEVGYLVDDVRFNTKIPTKPIVAIIDKNKVIFDKKNDALIAFPNDRPTVLKPWKNTTPCKTICAQLPRLVTTVDIDYDLNSREQKLRDDTNSYYLQYIRNLSKNNRNYDEFEEPELEDYEISDKRKALMKCFNKGMFSSKLLISRKFMQILFVPLTPYEIYNIILKPKLVQLGKLAANSACSDQFKIENKNNFPVHISIKALYNTIKITQEEFILEPNSQNTINFTYRSDEGGNHHIPMFVIMNFIHVIDITVLATVVANAVKCLNQNISIIPTEKTAFLELTNPINSDVSFEVDTKYFHLESFPTKGIIPARKNMAITITFNPEVGYAPVKEIAVISESGYKELIEVHFDHKKAAINISTELLEFKNIPLNTEVSQELIILNKSDQLVPINVEVGDEESFPELTITPNKALLWQKGHIIIKFTLKFTEVVDFNLPINLTFQYEYSRQIIVKGNVICPGISFKPELIKIPKIPCGCTIKSSFRIYNQTDVDNFVLFATTEYPEFTIKYKNGDKISDDGLVTLAPKERRDLLLEFHPQEAVAYCIYLPYILNGILGPPELNCQESLQVAYYFTPFASEFKTSKVVNTKLKALKILCAASKEWLQFNQLNFEFCTFGATEQTFQVLNVSGITQEIRLDIGDTKTFELIPISENIVMISDPNGLLIDLETESSFCVSIRFVPATYGEFSYNVPIIVKNYSDSIAFNNLTLKGVNQKPKIFVNPSSVYFTPAEIGSIEERKLTVDLLGHRNNCHKHLKVECESPQIEIWMREQRKESNIKTVAEYVVIFKPKNDCFIETQINFACSCSANCNVELFACSNSSVLINFMSEKSIINFSTYPLFPLESDSSPYAILLRSVLAIIERWIYTQGYFYKNYYRIPAEISYYPLDIGTDPKKAGFGKKNFPPVPLVQLLVNLMDKSILKYIDVAITPTADLEKRTVYKYAIYKNTLAFLKIQGISIPGLKPEHLLTFIEYKEFKNNLSKIYSIESNEDLNEQDFFRFSRQKWLDLFFHIYEVLVYRRIVDPKVSEISTISSEFLKKDREEFNDYLENNLNRFPTPFLCGTKLLLWLEFHYNRQKTVLWPNETFEKLQLEDLSNIDDGVCLATVTIAYCPYLKDYLNDVYAFPQNLEQKVHNSCRIVQAWKCLKLSFDVHPQTIVTANKIKIIFIVTYLYEVLPHFYPANEVIIDAPLSESATYNLTVQNCGNVPIEYNSIFFGENSSLFKLDCTTLSIPGGKTKTLKLTYYAKRVLNANTILVLSGESGGEKYAKSIAIKVIGSPKTTSSVEIKLPMETYILTKKKISLKSPYSSAYQAQIFICFEEPKSYNDLHSISFLQNHFIPREIDFTSTECDFLEKGEGSLTLNACLLTQGEIVFYLYLCNEIVGDFCVLMRLQSKLNKDSFQSIDINLQNDLTLKCSCKNSFKTNCPKLFTVEIPSKNEFLWTGTERIIEKSFSEQTVTLIKNFLGKPIEFRVLWFYLNHFPEGFMLSADLFDDKVEYNITGNKLFSAPFPMWKINDITAENTVPFLLHWNQDTYPNNQSVMLELISKNNKEIRRYKLIFPPKSASSSSATLSHSTKTASEKFI